MAKKNSAPILAFVLFVICLTSIARAQTSWWRTYGGSSSDYGYSVQQTADGGYIVAGSTESLGAGGDVCLIKTNAAGDTLWTRTYENTVPKLGYTVQQTADGGYIVAGSGSFVISLIRTDASGDTLWTRTYDDSVHGMGYSVQQTSDSGYIVGGFAWSLAGSDFCLIKTNASGDALWTRTYGGADGGDVGYSVQQTADGGYVVAGGTYSFGAGNLDVYLVKTNAAGDTLWTKTYGGTSYDEGRSVRQTADSGYIIAGWTSSFGTGAPDSDNVYLVKANSSGDTLWTKTYGGAGDDGCTSVNQTSDGGYIIAGQTRSFGAGDYDVYLIKTNSSGDTLWTRTYGGTDGDWGFSVQQTSDGGYVIAGQTRSFGAGGLDVYLIKTDSLGYVGVAEPLPGRPLRPTRFLVQPNPFTSFARVPGHETGIFALSDVTGRQVATCRGDRIGEGLRPGVYFLSPLVKSGNAAAAIIKTAR